MTFPNLKCDLINVDLPLYTFAYIELVVKAKLVQ